MRSNRTILPLVLLVLLSLGAVWWLASPDDARLANQPAPPDQASEVEDGRPLTWTKDRLDGAPLAGNEESTAARVEAPPTAAETSVQTEPGVETEEPVHVPVYGVGVQRGGAYATFHLTDAKDQPLYDPDVEVDLWRRVGIYWLRDEAYWDAERRAIYCDGRSAAGLEPGEYELEVRTDKYGSFLHRFRVNRGEHLESTLRTQTWRRIICIDFRLTDGSPVEWVKDMPQVSTKPDEYEFEPREDPPKDVLRDPPPDPRGLGRGRGGFAYRRARGGGGRTFAYKIATDAGRFYVPVVAGAMNTVRFRMGDYWGREDLSFEGRFLGQEWDRYEVVLELVPEFEELTAEWTKQGVDDPGNRSLLTWIERELDPPAPDDPSTVPYCRLVIDLEAPPNTRVMYGTTDKPDAEYKLKELMDHRGSLHYANVRQGRTVWFAFKYNGYRVSEPESLTFTKENSPVLRIVRTVATSTFSTPDWRLSPTLGAWAVQRELKIVLDREPVDWSDLRVWKLDHSNSTCRYPNKLTDILGDDPPKGVEYWWRIGGAADRLDSRRWQGEWRDNMLMLAMESASAAEARAALLSGNFAPPPVYGFALRVVGPNNEGLPWVEGSIVPYEQDERAQRLRKVERALGAVDARPVLGNDFGAAYYGREDDFGDETIDAEGMKIFLGEKFLEETNDKGDLAYYARSGAWYDTRAKISSDAAGYVFSQSVPVGGSNKYVLYLWSNSRDDLHPDARIVFQATGDLTDLGAITLPTYTK